MYVKKYKVDLDAEERDELQRFSMVSHPANVSSWTAQCCLKTGGQRE